MERDKETIRLNGLSKAIIAATVVLGLSVAVCAAPGEVAALGRGKASNPVAMKTLSDAPGLSLARAYGADDEDCISVATNRGGATKFVCAQ